MTDGKVRMINDVLCLYVYVLWVFSTEDMRIIYIKSPLFGGDYFFGGFMENRNQIKKRMGAYFDTRRLVGMAMFAALAYGVTFVFRIPVVFLTFDAKDAVLAIAAFIYGPVSAIIMSLIPALIELITISGTAFWGFLMNFISSASFSFTASLIYKHRKNLSGAIIGLYTAALVTTALMIPLNILIMPIFQKDLTAEAVIQWIMPLILPFNLAKTLMNASFVMLLYKPVVVAMRRAGLVISSQRKPLSVSASQSSDEETNEKKVTRPTAFKKKRTISALAFGLATLTVAIVIFVLLNR